MSLPLMPKATAAWLVENTALTFKQIADFCGSHELEIQAIADGEVGVGIMGMDPVAGGQLTIEEIKRCEENSNAKLKLVRSELPQPVSRTKGPRYTPVSKRADKPDGIVYLIKTHPELLDAQVARLIGTTKDTIAKVRDRSHWNAANIKPRSPVLLGLCKQSDLDAALQRASRRVARERKAAGIDENAQPFIDIPLANPFTAPLAKHEDSAQPDIDPETMFRSMG